MTLVVGVDSSLTGTGRAVVDDGKPLGVNVLRSTGKRADTVPQRQQRIRDLADRVTGWGRTQLVADWPAVGVVRPDLVVIEGPSHASRGGSPWDRAGLWWAILVRWQGVPVAVVPPSCRAKWATGKGNADKAAVAAVAARLCPDVDLPSSDAADALVLALMGAHALGERPDLDTAYRRDSLLKCEWPPDIAQRVLRPYETLETPDE